MFIKPTSARIEDIFSPLTGSLKDLEKIIKPIKKKNKMNTDVNLASHTHQVPHIGFPHEEPETKQINVNTAPIGAEALAII